MDRRKIRKQLAKKIELESQLVKPRELSSNGKLNDLNIKPSSTKSGTGTQGSDWIAEKPPKFSISTTNLKIKKAHATTLSDFFSQQREQVLGIKKQQNPISQQSQKRVARTSENKLPRMQSYKKNDLLNQNPMNFYHRNSNAIVQHILKISENSVLYNMARNKIQSNDNYSQYNNQDESPEESNKNSKPSTSTYPHSSLRNTNQLNQLRNLTQLTQQKQQVQFQHQENEFSKQQNNIQNEVNINEKNQNEANKQGNNQIKTYKQQIIQNISNEINQNQNNLRQMNSTENNFKFSREQSTPNLNYFPSAGRDSVSQRTLRSTNSKFTEKKREEIKNPKKFYFLNSLNFKNYKYPRPLEMPYEKESEKLTRMPLYLLPQSAPSKQIEDICISKYYSEVQEIEQSIVEKQQTLLQNSQRDISEQQGLYNNEKVTSAENLHLKDLEDMKLKYLTEIQYLQKKAVSHQKKGKFKVNAKYTFSDSKNKYLNQINMRSNKIEDLSDKLYRIKNKIEEQMATTKANLSRLYSDNSSLMQQNSSMQNKLQLNQTIQQLYKELVYQSDELKSNHKYTEEYRQKLEEQDEEGVEPEEYEQYNEYDEELEYENSQNNQDKGKNKKKSQEMQSSIEEQPNAYIQEETEEEFQNEVSSYKNTESQIQQQISAQEDYINRFIKNNSSNQQNDFEEDEYQQNKFEDDQQIYEQQQQQQSETRQKEMEEAQEDDEEEEEDQIKIHSLADFKNAHPLTDKDIIQKTQLGQLMMSVLIETFSVLKFNRPALRNRILLSLGLNPQDTFQSVPKDVFKFFYEILVSKTATVEQNVQFILKFFKLDDDDDELQENRNEDNQEQILKGEQGKLKVLDKKKLLIDKDEFKRILRILTISIDEKAKQGEKSLFDYMIENLILTEVIKPNEQQVDLDQFKSILLEGKINSKDIIDLISNLQ
ncbi:hypothetical protein TTHERM_00471520 (macronuclear) [Tetrahymena thermophila SB210]|uniref:Uncharacterized protein n=1 Tax=Tetrahymena thermophila (strain SB210) TaxID=312017 RepID=I7MGP5_TETTS|nr:hypothetical protein TTHERM_00471520 [Tetrahymena thermophila SB210]EAR85375.2 hypothetical protein TTHERM_00471520 [Tetrahymena thermophila SB210]|eukprot:XP_001033038.2 hypothetical protein TTHERM_00471520 [Tetrahymena thermophila SB210]